MASIAEGWMLSVVRSNYNFDKFIFILDTDSIALSDAILIP